MESKADDLGLGLFPLCQMVQMAPAATGEVSKALMRTERRGRKIGLLVCSLREGVSWGCPNFPISIASYTHLSFPPCPSWENGVALVLFSTDSLEGAVSLRIMVGPGPAPVHGEQRSLRCGRGLDKMEAVMAPSTQMV